MLCSSDKQWKTIIIKTNFLDLGMGGSLYSRVSTKAPDVLTAKLILAEIVIAVEELHRLNIIHGDLNTKNIVIDGDGHLILTDFGFAEKHPDEEWPSKSKRDWEYLSSICYSMFCRLKRDEIMQSLIHMLRNMTDIQLPGKWVIQNDNKTFELFSFDLEN